MSRNNVKTAKLTVAVENRSYYRLQPEFLDVTRSWHLTFVIWLLRRGIDSQPTFHLAAGRMLTIVLCNQ